MAHQNRSDERPSDSDFLALQQALLGRYSLERELGRGGMGVVYLAHEVALDRPVALKLLPPALAAQPALRERFLREARTAAKLSHPHIVPIHAVDEVDGFVFFAMAFVDGETLGERVRTRGPLPGAEAAKVLREVSWALAYAHAEGVIHRDVKPDNILLERGSGRALVTDFGIAHVSRGEGLTSVGEVLGTAEFMSPEQASGEEVRPGADLYALGVVGFYALTGRVPFEGASTAAVLAKHLTQPAPPVASVAPGAPRELAAILDRCLRKAPGERFPDGGALAEALAPSVAVERQLPVPLRVFLGKTRKLAEAAPMVLVLWFVIALATLLGEVQEWPLAILAMLAAYFLAPFAPLLAHARRLLKAGYRLDDARLALDQDVEQRLEEIRWEFGKGLAPVDRVLRFLTAAGFATLLVALVGIALGLPGDLVGLGVVGWNVGLFSFFGAAFRNKRRRDVIGESLRSLFGGRAGEWIFRLGGLGLEGGALGAGGAHRPTEMAIGIAADELFGELPKSVRRELAGLPDAIERLGEGAARMRRQAEELDALLGRVGDDRDGIADDERARLRGDLEATREAALRRRREAISSLERIRLGLLRLHAGEDIVDSLTVDLGSAEDVAAAIERLADGHEEVRRMLGGTRGGGQAAAGPLTPPPTPVPARR